MKYRYTICMLLIALVSYFFVSCESKVEIIPLETVELSFMPNEAEEKTLVAEIDTATAYYSYTAEPLFELSTGGIIHGGTDGKEVQLGSTGKESAGRFTQGKWKFHIYAYNAAGELIRDGGTTTYLSKNAVNDVKVTVPVTIYRTALRTGSAHFAIGTTAVSADKPYVKVTPIREGVVQPTRIFYATSINSDNSASFDFEVGGLKSGAWEFTVELFDHDIKIGGGAVSTYIIGNGTTKVSGQIYPSEWVEAGFDIIMPTPVKGTIGSSIEIAPGSANFSWTSSSGRPDRYVWYVNGEKITFGSSKFVHDFKEPGVYSVTCVAEDSQGHEMGHSTVSVTVKGAVADKLSFTWANPSKGVKREIFKAPVTGNPLLRVHMEELGGVITYSGYPSLIRQDDGSWKGTVACSYGGASHSIGFTIKAGMIEADLPEAYTGFVILEIAL